MDHPRDAADPYEPEETRAALASHNIKIIFAQHGTLDPSPGDNLPPPDAMAASEPHTNKGKRRRIFS
jgi:hypothetical protein